jgi:ribose transport system substrate-binding protein
MHHALKLAIAAGLCGAALSQVALAKDQVEIGIAQPNLEHPYRVGGIERAKAWGAAHPEVKLTIVDGRRDSAVQLSGIEDLVTRRVDAIVMSPNDSTALAPAADAAARAGIPLIVFDRKLDAPESKIAAFIGADNVEMGRVAARFIVQQIGEDGVVIQLEGTPGASASVDRKKGFEEEIGKHKGLKVYSYVGHYRLQEAVNAMEDGVTAHRDVKAVFAHNDTMALGAAQVLAERKIPGVVTVGMDGASEGCKGITEGKLTGSVYYPTMFPEALELAVKVLDKQPVQKATFVQTPMITKETWSSYCK